MVKLSAKNRKIKHFTLRQSNQDDQPNAWPSTFSHFVCHVVFDSQVHAPFVGLRAVGSLGRRVRFEAEDCEIDLGITPDPATLRLYLEGQITPSAGDASGGWLRLSKA